METPAVVERQERRKEEKGGALPLWLSMAGGPAATELAVGETLGLPGWLIGVLQKVQAVLSTRAAMMAALAAATAVSLAGAWGMYRRSTAPHPAASGRPILETVSERRPAGEDGARGRSGIDMFKKANRGMLGVEASRAPAEDKASKGAAGDGVSAVDDAVVDAVLAEAAGGGGGSAKDRRSIESNSAGATKDPAGGVGGETRGAGGFGRLQALGGLSGAGGTGAAGGAGRLGMASASRADPAGTLDALRKAASSPKIRRTPVARRGGVSPGRSTQRKLSRMARNMAYASKMAPQPRAQVHTQQWDGAGLAAGSIADPPALNIPRSQAAAAPAAAPAVDNDEGGPIPRSQAVPPGWRPPDVGPTRNVTPYQGLIDMATILIMLAVAALVAAYILGTLKMHAAAEYVAFGAMGLGAIVASLGVVLMLQGQTLQGALLLAVGGMITFLAMTAAKGNAKAAAAGRELQNAALPPGNSARMALSQNQVPNTLLDRTPIGIQEELGSALDRPVGILDLGKWPW